MLGKGNACLNEEVKVVKGAQQDQGIEEFLARFLEHQLDVIGNSERQVKPEEVTQEVNEVGVRGGGQGVFPGM